MRDNHDGLPEILDAYERDGSFFGVVQVKTDDEVTAFEIGVERDGYWALRRILQARPFEATDLSTYRYFFVPSVRRLSNQRVVEFKVRIERGRDGKQFSFFGPQSLVSNLMWFFELKSLAGAEHLTVVSSRSA